MASAAFGEEELTTSAQDDEARWMDRPPPAPGERGAAVQSTSDVEQIMAETKETDEIETRHAVPTSQRDSGVKSGLPDDLILEISAGLQNQDQCMGLALLLKIDHGEILKSLHTTFDSRTASTIIKKWIKHYPEHATGRALYCALCDIGRQDLADKSKDRLLQRGDPDIQSEREVTPVAERASALVDAQHASGVKFDLPDDLILEISAGLQNLDQCMGLALMLKIGHDEMLKLLQTPYNNQMAYTIIKQWMGFHAEEATGRTLHCALCGMGRQDLADKFEGSLLQRGVTEVENEREATHSVEQTTAVANAQRTGGVTVDLQDDLILEISAGLHDLDQCMGLALMLKIGHGEMLKLSQTPYNDRMAYTVIKQWMEVHAEEVTGRTLHSALCDIGRQDLADKFEERLLQRGVTEFENDGKATHLVQQATGVANAHCTSGVKLGLQDDLIFDVSSGLHDLDQCMQLALVMKISHGEILKLLQTPYNNRMAYTVIKQWMEIHGEEATGCALHGALCDIGRRDLAEEFEGRLLQTGVTQVQSGRKLTDLAERNPAVAQPDLSGRGKFGSEDQLLLLISAGFRNRDECFGLALKLKIGDEEVLKLLHTPYDERMAFIIMKKWLKVYEEQATGLALHAALCGIERADLADQFERELLGKGVVLHQSTRPVTHANEQDLKRAREAIYPEALVHGPACVHYCVSVWACGCTPVIPTRVKATVLLYSCNILVLSQFTHKPTSTGGLIYTSNSPFNDPLRPSAVALVCGVCMCVICAHTFVLVLYVWMSLFLKHMVANYRAI